MNRHIRNVLLVMCLFVTISFVTFSYAAFNQELMITGGEAYIEAPPDKRLSSYITEMVNKTNDLENLGGGIRYVGSNPNNYVYYNGESWRIIGVFDVQTETGVQKLTKLARMDPVEIMSWDASEQNLGHGKNDYSTSKMRDYLFYNFYYKSYDNNNRYTCINGTGYDHTYQCDYKGLAVTAASMVEKVYWNLGSTNPYVVGESNVFTPAFLLQSEQSSAQPNTCRNGGFWSRCSENGVRPSSVLDYVGLAYASDVGFAAGSVCAQNAMGDNCFGNSWYAPPGMAWTINPAYSRDYADLVLGNYYGMLWTTEASTTWGTRPVLYLKNEVKRMSGTGSQGDPYILAYDGPIGIDTPTTNYAPKGEDVSSGSSPIIDPVDPNGKYTSTHSITQVTNWANHYTMDFSITNKYGRDLTDWTIIITFKSGVTLHDDTQVHVQTYSQIGSNKIKINSLDQYYAPTQHPIGNNATLRLSDLGNITLSITTNGSISNINDAIQSIELKDSRENF